MSRMKFFGVGPFALSLSSAHILWLSGQVSSLSYLSSPTHIEAFSQHLQVSPLSSLYNLFLMNSYSFFNTQHKCHSLLEAFPYNQIITNLEPSTGDSWPRFGDQVDSYISVSALSENGKFCSGTIPNFYFIFISFFRKAVIVNRKKSLS